MSSSTLYKQLTRTLGTRVAERRKQLGLTQKEVAKQIDLSVELVSRIESCRCLPSLESLCRLTTVLGVSADWLIGSEPSATVGELLRTLEILREDQRAVLMRLALALRKGDPS